ncbi:MAG TPA: hypothetical protein VGL72_22675 [Bryobacteraceae bacterium]
MKKPVLLAIVFVVGLLAVILYTSLAGSNSKYRGEVCITFQGHTECRTARAATHNEALRTATDNACTMMASGQSEFERCRNTPPTKETWLSGE